MNTEPGRETPAAMLDELRAHAEWTDRQRDAVFDRLVERFPPEELIATVLGRVGDLGGADAEAILRLVEAYPRPPLLAALAGALAAQADLPPERAWDALAVLDGAGVLGDYPALVNRWDELNEGLDEAGSIEELAEQIEGDPEGIWLALQGLVAVEPEVRPEIVAGLARVPLGPGLIEFFRLLAYSHDEATRVVALAALSADPPGGQPLELQEAWLDIAAHHTDSAALATARQRLGTGSPGLPAKRSGPRVGSAVVGPVDGRGRGTIVLSASHEGKRASAAFLCDVELGVVEIGGDIEPESPYAGTAFEEMSARVGRETVSGSLPLAMNLLAGSLWLSGPATPPTWRFWVEKTAGPLRPRPFRTGFPDLNFETLTPAQTAGHSRAVLDACPDWLDTSPLTYEMAEEILLREGDSTPDPKRDSGAYRFLFEHRLKGRLEAYRRMLLWMAEFWRAAGDDGLAVGALVLASQLSDAQHVVPGHPFTVALTTRSLASAQDGLHRGVDPRRAPRP